MSVKSKLAALEKRMQVGDLVRNCPACRRRPAEIVYLLDEGEEVPPSQAPPCPLCGKGPMQIVMDMTEGGAPERPQLLRELTR